MKREKRRREEIARATANPESQLRLGSAGSLSTCMIYGGIIMMQRLCYFKDKLIHSSSFFALSLRRATQETDRATGASLSTGNKFPCLEATQPLLLLILRWTTEALIREPLHVHLIFVSSLIRRFIAAAHR